MDIGSSIVFPPVHYRVRFLADRLGYSHQSPIASHPPTIPPSAIVLPAALRHVPCNISDAELLPFIIRRSPINAAIIHRQPIFGLHRSQGRLSYQNPETRVYACAAAPVATGRALDGVLCLGRQCWRNAGGGSVWVESHWVMDTSRCMVCLVAGLVGWECACQSDAVKHRRD